MKNLFVKIFDVEPVIKSHGRQSRQLVSPKTMGAKGFAMGYHIMGVGGQSPKHVHEKEQEAMIFLEGYGKAKVGEEEFDIEPLTAMLAPANVPHSIINTGNTELKFIWIFSPPKPEQL